ncbi:FG-GAP-like repeat-containing protein [Saccharicrinis sp. FJH2]|uniref:FG-GAP-like repeat-containing protein n=1 Tax=Saccharicrinis sp. FJH65 TaxID=3344659 RepID=UPI0035F477B9
MRTNHIIALILIINTTYATINAQLKFDKSVQTFGNDIGREVKLADINNDGFWDIVSRNGNMNGDKIYIRFWLNNGAGNFDCTSIKSIPFDSIDISCVDLGDVDSDDDLNAMILYSADYQKYTDTTNSKN